MGVIACLAGCMMFFTGCVPSAPGTGAASQRANEIADNNMYKPVNYQNASKRGPVLVVLPGEIKASNATFTQKITSNNIADFGEIELSNANFRVLERTDLGPLLKEIQLGVTMGDPTALRKFKKGKFKSTKWFVKFDILKAEKTGAAGSGFNGQAIGSIFNTLVGGTGGAVGGTALSSTRTSDEAGVWVVGLRYKILDASTSEQVSTGYKETKMEAGAKANSFLGISGHAEKFVTLDTIVQRLVQEAVVEIDKQK